MDLYNRSMETLFRVLPLADWELALVTGLVPRCPADNRHDRIHLNDRESVERAASLWFTPEEAPVAIEIDVTTLAADIQWEMRAEEPLEVWPNLYALHIPADLVLKVYLLKPLANREFCFDANDCR